MIVCFYRLSVIAFFLLYQLSVIACFLFYLQWLLVFVSPTVSDCLFLFYQLSVIAFILPTVRDCLYLFYYTVHAKPGLSSPCTCSPESHLSTCIPSLGVCVAYVHLINQVKLTMQKSTWTRRMCWCVCCTHQANQTHSSMTKSRWDVEPVFWSRLLWSAQCCHLCSALQRQCQGERVGV